MLKIFFKEFFCYLLLSSVLGGVLGFKLKLLGFIDFLVVFLILKG